MIREDRSEERYIDMYISKGHIEYIHSLAFSSRAVLWFIQEIEEYVLTC